jgi:hypothetical protein
LFFSTFTPKTGYNLLRERSKKDITIRDCNFFKVVKEFQNNYEHSFVEFLIIYKTVFVIFSHTVDHVILARLNAYLRFFKSFYPKFQFYILDLLFLDVEAIVAEIVSMAVLIQMY